MNTNMVKDILQIPEKFYDPSVDKSFYTLLKESGYFEDYDKISEEDIYQELLNHPEAIDQWEGWSDDKRTTSGWYLRKKDNIYIVAFFPKNDSVKPIEFSDPAKACAVFIIKELEDTRLER
jgi:hypothetical protein